MARINIEEKFWSDPRKDSLGDLLGNRLFVMEVVTKSWRTAQTYWEKGELIPGHVFVTIFGYYELLQANLAVLHENKSPESSVYPTPIQHISNTDPSGTQRLQTHKDLIQQAYIYVRGSKEFLSWGAEIRQKRSDAGKKSAQRARDAKGRLLKKSPETQQISNIHPTNTNTVQLSGSGSGSGSGSSSSFKKKNNVGIRTDYPQDFEKVWLKYGRIGDKKEAYDQFKALGLKPDGVDYLEKAISGYFRKVPEAQFRKHFGRFLKMDWREFLDKKVTDPSQYPHTHKQTQPEAFQTQTEHAGDEVIEEIMKKFPRIVRELPR